MKMNQDGSSTTKIIQDSLGGASKNEALEWAQHERDLLVEDHLSNEEKKMIMGRQSWTDLCKEQEKAHQSTKCSISKPK